LSAARTAYGLLITLVLLLLHTTIFDPYADQPVSWQLKIG